jgi:protein-S-isoprenylcysteine O-methyltransferase Ste14
MALVHSLEKNGNFLFKYRGQIPVVLFLMAIPAIYFTDYEFLNGNEDSKILLTIVAAIISFSGQVIRAIAIGTSNKHTSGRNTKEQVAEALNTKGIYSTVRHPLYLGNYFMWIGIVVYTFNIWFVLVISLLFWLYYERIMFAEERFLERKFGDSYVKWSMNVPAFWPSFKNYEKTPIPFSIKTIMRREYSGITATILGFVFIDFFRDWFTSGEVQWKMNHGIVVFIALLISLVFRTLKHNTKILFEEDRS